MASEDEFNFENDESIGGNSSIIRSSQGSNASSLLGGKFGRTRSQRKKARQEEEEEKTELKMKKLDWLET